MPARSTPPPRDGGFDLERFVEAQADGVHDRAVAELRGGRKRSHWMWFVFPQVAGLGSSEMAARYAIRSRAEAEAYLAHPVLGPRLLGATDTVLGAPSPDVVTLLGPVDALKLRSCMTLFAATAPDPASFRAVLARWFDGGADSATLALLEG
ncbi:calpastatin [Curtobacterium sp. Leaf261]|nr:calpastatin [Curtobacterium sp. Leaf261]